MTQVTDPRGAVWSVRRRRWYRLSAWMFTDSGGVSPATLVTSVVVIGLWWPFWFVAHWLGLPWRIVIKRDGHTVGEERVRGWGRSRRRIREILAAATAGTPRPQGLSEPA
ncbi:hypothetical protein [Mycobacterium sp. E787]|uniref:hypothetical protein n=1 Tax=Mycobacterium sp. E787 TaxID=1834150 RepID=UPI0007FCEC8E|nr:hypothetical protein [Mycobacterium sp. E787]OBI51483.1 hypothetical protein A5705_08310 [Mycobacterium sp. E787]